MFVLVESHDLVDPLGNTHSIDILISDTVYLALPLALAATDRLRAQGNKDVWAKNLLPVDYATGGVIG